MFPFHSFFSEPATTVLHSISEKEFVNFTLTVTFKFLYLAPVGNSYTILTNSYKKISKILDELMK